MSGASGLTGTSGTSGLTGGSGASGLMGGSGASRLTGDSGASGLTGDSGGSGQEGEPGGRRQRDSLVRGAAYRRPGAWRRHRMGWAVGEHWSSGAQPSHPFYMLDDHFRP